MGPLTNINLLIRSRLFKRVWVMACVFSYLAKASELLRCNLLTFILSIRRICMKLFRSSPVVSTS